NVPEQLQEQLLGARVVDKPGLQGADDLDELLDRELILRVHGLERREGVFDQRTREFGERPGAGARRIDEDVPGVEAAAALLIPEVRVEVDGAHGISLAENGRGGRTADSARGVYGGGGRGSIRAPGVLQRTDSSRERALEVHRRALKVSGRTLEGI